MCKRSLSNEPTPRGRTLTSKSITRAPVCHPAAVSPNANRSLASFVPWSNLTAVGVTTGSGRTCRRLVFAEYPPGVPGANFPGSPSPRAPEENSPQVKTLPSAVRAALCQSPIATEMTDRFCNPGLISGVDSGVVVSSPIRTRELDPVE